MKERKTTLGRVMVAAGSLLAAVLLLLLFIILLAPPGRALAGPPPTPSTFYGQVLPGPPIFTPTIGVTVTAMVNGYLCGQTTTQGRALALGARAATAGGPGSSEDDPPGPYTTPETVATDGV